MMAKRPDIAKVREANADARTRAIAAARARARANADARAAAGGADTAVAPSTSPPIVTHTGDTIPPPPQLHLVQPGDLITAQYINDVVAAIQDLQLRMDLLETSDDGTQPGGGVA
jgi:hypothetical protein